MSIVTKTGDQGTTALMYNRRVPKCDARVEAYGALDELNAALGLARATAEHPLVAEHLLRVQQDLIVVMGEVATVAEDLPRYVKDGYSVVGAEMTARLDRAVAEVEPQCPKLHGWALPGASLPAAALDLARTICRRAERRVCELQQAGEIKNLEIIAYLNRLSDFLWLLARWAEHHNQPKAR